MWLTVLVALPLFAIAWTAVSADRSVLAVLMEPVTRSALWLSTWSSLVVAAVNAVVGTAIAFVLVRGKLRFASALDAAVDLPFALPTLLPGVLLVALLGPQTLLGALFKDAGLPIAFAPAGVIIVLLFVTLPFVVRAVEPVLRALDVAEEEAAAALGASSTMTFFRVVLPALRPAIAAGALQSFARALGEFGSVVVVSGNIPGRTLTGPALVYSEVESGMPARAAVVSFALLLLAVSAQLGVRALSPHRAAGGGRRG